MMQRRNSLHGREEQEQKSTLQAVYRCMRNRVRQRQFQFQQSQIKELCRVLAGACKLQQRLKEVQQEAEEMTRRTAQTYEDKLRVKQSQHSQKLMQMAASFGQKQQSCKVLIAHFLQSLNQAQKHISVLHQRLRSLHHSCAQQRSDAQTITQLLARNGCEDHSLFDEDELMSQRDKIMGKEVTNQLQASPIGQTGTGERVIEESLNKLVAFGFFCRDNAQNVERLQEMQKGENFLTAFQNENYSVVVQLIKLALLPHEEVAMMHLDGHYSSHYDDIQLRHINNLSQLSVSDVKY